MYDNKCFSYIENSYQDMLNLTCKLANINSGSYNIEGINKINSLLVQEFFSLADSSELIDLPNYMHMDLQGNMQSAPLGKLLHLKKNNQAKLNILFVGHTDTVFDLNSNFQSVTALDKENTMINGPGVADMKGGIVVILYALRALAQTNLAKKFNWEVILNPDEELGSPGSVKYLQAAAKDKHYGLLYEPAIDLQGNLAGQRKGSAEYTIVVHGKAAHAGRAFHDGKNAIVALVGIISEINSLNEQQKAITFNIGQIEGGEAVNIVAQKAVCTLGVRSLNLEDEVWVATKLNSIIAKANTQDKINATLHGCFTKKPKILDENTLELYELVKSVSKGLGQDINWQPSGGVCDGNNLSAVGLPNVDTLGVIGGKIHTDQEFLITESLVSRAKFTVAILQELVGNY